MRMRFRPLLGYLGAAAVTAVVVTPLALEAAVERVRVEDSIGTLPVSMTLCRQGRSTVETGILGDVHWEASGPGGFGVRARVTGPPVAGGTLASYADRRFIRANLEFIENPDAAVSSYAAEFRSQVVSQTLLTSVGVGLAGGLVVVALVRGLDLGQTRRRTVLLAGASVAALLASTGGAYLLFERWPCNQDPGPTYALPGVPQLSFSNRETQEIALQIRPFIEKNTRRIAERAEAYEQHAVATFTEQLQRRAAALRPRPGEVVVSAEADPQGAFVGTAVREALYPLLVAALGEGAVVLRTVSGDVTSNGTHAEDAFVAREAAALDGVPVAAVGGDHDSETTWDQLRDSGVVVPDLEVAQVAGLRVAGAHDVEHKALFGQLVTNESGLTEEELGARLRVVVDEGLDPDEAAVVLLHQPDAVAGYLGVDSIAQVRSLEGSLTQPYDDGVPDVPAGTVNVGHLHAQAGPWVLWNTDGDEVTWTVVDQLGTSGGVEPTSTFNRFSTPVSTPLRPMAWRLQYLDRETGLQTGFASVTCDLQGRCRISDRTDVGLPLPRR